MNIVKWLIEERNLDVNGKDSGARTALHHAVRHQRLEVVEWLVEKGNADVDEKDQDGRTALHYSVMFGHFEILYWLFDGNNVDVNAKDNAGWTVLHFAAQDGQLVTVVEGLAENTENNEVDLTATDNEGRTALHIAAIDDPWGVAETVERWVLGSDRFYKENDIWRQDEIVSAVFGSPECCSTAPALKYFFEHVRPQTL